MALQKFADHLKAPWPNGRGTSFEIASQTPGVAGWTWRVAIAPVVEDCDFSHFENVHRQLLIISGDEMILNVGGENVVCKPNEVAVFAGDIPTTAKLYCVRSFEVLKSKSCYECTQTSCDFI